jgi:hypothetical protein
MTRSTVRAGSRGTSALRRSMHQSDTVTIAAGRAASAARSMVRL